jgi:hypothetical protein
MEGEVVMMEGEGDVKQERVRERASSGEREALTFDSVLSIGISTAAKGEVAAGWRVDRIERVARVDVSGLSVAVADVGGPFALPFDVFFGGPTSPAPLLLSLSWSE